MSEQSRIHAFFPWPQAPIDLANVCFDGGVSPDRLAALDALLELQAYAPDRCAIQALMPCTSFPSVLAVQ